MDIGKVIFIIGIVTVLHTYLIYPFILFLWNYIKPKKITTRNLESFPDVTFLIPGHNIEHLLDIKIKNLMKVTYEGNLKYLLF